MRFQTHKLFFRSEIQVLVCVKHCFSFPVISVCLIRVVTDLCKFVHPTFLDHSSFSNAVAAMGAVRLSN